MLSHYLATALRCFRQHKLTTAINRGRPRAGLFAHSAGLSVSPFLFSLIVTLSVAWLAVVTQATRAARLKPATVLRYE